MSLLYKALNQAAQQRENGALKADPATRGSGRAATVPLAERLMAQGGKPRFNAGGPRRVVRVVLFGLAGLGMAAVLLALFAPLAPPQKTATTEPVAPGPVAPETAVAPGPEPVPPQPKATDLEAGNVVTSENPAAPEDGQEDTEPPLAESPLAPQARIGAGYEPKDFASPQKRILEGGLEKYVGAQLARESVSGLPAPLEIDRTASAAIGHNTPVEITDDTAIVRERYESAADMLERGHPDESLQIYEQLLRNNPKDRLALLGRAAALQKLGRSLMAVSAYEDVLAARNLEKAVSLQPENSEYVFNLAVAYDKWGQPKAALRYYRQCLEMAAQNPDGQVPLEAVRQRMAFLDVK